uniref:Putative transmembrane protein n=1 Tax=biofilter metagenome TaxID=1070537 RepID=A0A193SCZ4_9ZZZZ
MDKTVPSGAALLLDFTRLIETGKTDRSSYDVIYGHNEGKISKKVTSMTVDELIGIQPTLTKRFKSSAAGGYQFMRNTLRDLKVELRLHGSQIMDPDLQDRLAYHLAIRRGYNDFISGKISRTEFGRRLAQEWASFPVLAPTNGASRALQRGETFYAGDKLNKVLVTPERMEAILDKVKTAGSAVPSADQVVVVEKVPVVADPGELGESPVKSKTVITNFLTGIGMAVTAVGSFLGGLDWRVQLFICAMVGGFAVYAIKRRFDLYKAVKELSREFV